MKQLLITISLIVASLVFTDAYAQDVEMTPYEQKREQLGVQAMEKVMKSMSAYDQALFSINLMNALKDAHEEGDRYQEMIISENILFALCDLGEGLQTEANLLSRSFDVNDVYAGETLQAWREIGQWYKQERLKLDQTKTAEDIQREKDRAELMGNHSGIRGVKQRVKKVFLKWAKKDQFEKTVAYNERLSKKGTAVFDSLCFVHFNEMINSEMNRVLDQNYDADKEGYGVRFFYGEKGDESAYVDAFWPITPQQLRIVEKINWGSTYSKGLFVKDGYYFPAIYHLEMTTSGWASSPEKWDIVLGEPMPVLLSIKDVIGDSVACDLEHTFDYSQYSINLLTQEEFVWQVWRFFNENDNPYLKKNDTGIGNFPYMQGKQYKEIFPEGKKFYTKEEVDSIMQRITVEKAAKEKEEADNARIAEFINSMESRNMGLWELDSLSREETLKFLDVYDSRQRGELIAKLLSEIVDTLSQFSSASNQPFNQPYYLPDVLRLIKKIDNSSQKYDIDMVPIYSVVIEKVPYYAKKYRKGTPEEKVAKFRSKEMSSVVVIER